MPRTFADFWNNLMGDIPALDQFRAQDFINYAWRDIREARRWSFLTAESSFDIPDEIADGTASVAMFSDVVVGDATARAVWDALGLNIPITDRQFRVGSGPLYQIIAYDVDGDSTANTWNTTGAPGALRLDREYKESSSAFVVATASVTETALNPIDGTSLTVGSEVFVWVNAVVNPTDVLIGATKAISYQNMVDVINATTTTPCIAVLSGTVITLTAIIAGTAGNALALSISDATYGVAVAFSGGTDGGATYQIYKAYFSPPSIDFLSFTSVKDIQNGRNLKLDLTRDDLNRKDPMRQSFGNPDYVALGKADSAGEIKVELWPHMLSAYSLVVEYERAGEDFEADDVLPLVIPESLLMERALCYACRWANDNRNRYDALKGINWAVNIAAHELNYTHQLMKVQIVDEEGSPSNISYAPDFYRYRGHGDTRLGQATDDGMIHW